MKTERTENVLSLMNGVKYSFFEGGTPFFGILSPNFFGASYVE